MKFYLVEQDILVNYDVYDSMIVSAESESDAKTLHPNGKNWAIYKNQWREISNKGIIGSIETYHGWIEPKDLDTLMVKYLGETNMIRGVILASFNAG